MEINLKNRKAPSRCRPFSLRYNYFGNAIDLRDTFQFYGADPKADKPVDISEERFQYYMEVIK